LALLIVALLCGAAAQALTQEQARALAVGEAETRIAALNAVIRDGADEAAVALIQAMSDDAVKFSDRAVYVMKDGQGHDPVSGAEVTVPDAAEDVVNNNQMRSELDAALASVKLASKDVTVRAEAVKTLQSEPDEAKLPLIEKAYDAESVPQIKAALGQLRSAMLLGSADKAKRLAAARALGESGTPATKTLLLERQKVEPEAAWA
jgi:urea transport system permease protein